MLVHQGLACVLNDIVWCGHVGRHLLQNDDDGTDGGRRLLQNDDDGTDGGRFSARSRCLLFLRSNSTTPLSLWLLVRV